jgi:hypothetical protein
LTAYEGLRDTHRQPEEYQRIMKTNGDTPPRNSLPNSDAVSGGDSLGRKSAGFKKGFQSRKIGPFTLLPNVSKFEVDLQ